MATINHSQLNRDNHGEIITSSYRRLRNELNPPDAEESVMIPACRTELRVPKVPHAEPKVNIVPLIEEI